MSKSSSVKERRELQQQQLHALAKKRVLKVILAVRRVNRNLAAEGKTSPPPPPRKVNNIHCSIVPTATQHLLRAVVARPRASSLQRRLHGSATSRSRAVSVALMLCCCWGSRAVVRRVGQKAIRMMSSSNGLSMIHGWCDVWRVREMMKKCGRGAKGLRVDECSKGCMIQPHPGYRRA